MLSGPTPEPMDVTGNVFEGNDYTKTGKTETVWFANFNLNLEGIYKVYGNTVKATEIYPEGVNVCSLVIDWNGNNTIEALNNVPPVIDPSAKIDPTATIGNGAQIMAGAKVKAGATVDRCAVRKT